MSKASTRQFEFITKSDPDTGARVTRLSPADTACHRTYFYQKCFSNDGNQLVFGARSGDEWHYHRLDLQTRVATQLTDQPGENTFGGFLSPHCLLYTSPSPRDA
jgi:oligogalacturonide lyase